MITQTHETDVLIIGGSAAGMYAALTAWDQGVKVTVISKALLGRGGCSATFGYIGTKMGGVYNYKKLIQLDSTQDKSFPDKVKYYGHYLVDQEIAEQAWSYPDTFCHRLEELGFYIRRRDDGTIVSAGDFGYGFMGPKHGMTGKGIMDVFRSQIFKRQIPVFEESMAVTLI